MRIVESPDGSVRVVELDPMKWYWLIVDREAQVNLTTVRRRDGAIILKNAAGSIAFVENADRLESPTGAYVTVNVAVKETINAEV